MAPLGFNPEFKCSSEKVFLESSVSSSTYPHRLNPAECSPLDVPEHLRVAQELPEVDVEHVAAGLQHDVVVVAVTDPQDVGRHAAARARIDEVLHRLGEERQGNDSPCSQAGCYCSTFYILVILLILLSKATD